MTTTEHGDGQHTIEQPTNEAPTQLYYDNPLGYNWERSSKIGSVTGAGMGAAVGAAIGAAGMFIGAIPGAIIGSVVGMLVGLAGGAALDAVAVSFKSGV